MDRTAMKPVPIPDDESAPFFEGAKRHKLMLLRCPSCRTFMWPGAPFATSIRRRCVECFHGDLEWVPVSGRGTLYTFALMHQVYDPGFADEVPYNVSIVELGEGPRMTSNIIGCANEDLCIGMPVEVVFEDIMDAVTIPKFRPSGDTA